MYDKEEKQYRNTMQQERRMMFHRRHWLRHNAMVPKGFLRYHVLDALNHQPMSGSELIDEIQRITGGAWKPSPGSIYPLLAWLQDNCYIKELPTENGFKRYELTQSGKELLEEQKKIRDQFTQNSGFLASPFFDGFFGKLSREKSEQVRASTKRLFVSTIRLSKALREKYSEKELDEALKVIDEASDKLEQIRTRITGEQNS